MSGPVHLSGRGVAGRHTGTAGRRRRSPDELLEAADLLLVGLPGLAPASQRRGAAIALRAALEAAVDRLLERQVAGLAQVSVRAKMLCLRYYTDPPTAQRAATLWGHLCLACHYHQYEIGPTHAQVVAWRDETVALLAILP
ncbi:MAG: hypothetical protein IRZ08_03065 [Frankia sp.]|nr:hypothetical protein [Frankia sp.]